MDQSLPSTSAEPSNDLNTNDQDLQLQARLNLVNVLKRAHSSGQSDEMEAIKRQRLEEPSTSSRSALSTEKTDSDSLQAICQQMYLANLRTTLSTKYFQMLSLLENNSVPDNPVKSSLDSNLAQNCQQTMETSSTITSKVGQPKCSVTSPPFTMLQHPPIIPLLSQLFASARLSHSVQIPITKFERKPIISSTSLSTHSTQNFNQTLNPFLLQSSSSSSTTSQLGNKVASNNRTTKITQMFDEPSITSTEANNYMQINLLETAARLAFGSILILEMERKALGFTEPSCLAAKYIPQIDLIQVPVCKLQLIQQEIDHLTAPLFPPLIKPYTKDGDKQPTEQTTFQNKQTSTQITGFQNEFYRQLICQALNVYEQQIQEFINDSGLAQLRKTQEKFPLKNVAVKRKHALKHVKDQQTFLQTAKSPKLPTIQELVPEQKPHHLDELLANYQPFVFVNTQLKNEEEKNSEN